MRKYLILIIMFAFLAQMSPTESLALSCAELPSVEEAYEKYDGVIIGRVDKVIKHGAHDEVQITVSKSFKGVDVNRIPILENSTWGSMWGPSEVGGEYVFFLEQKSGKWVNPLCSPTVKLADADEHLDYLKNKEIPIKEAETSSMIWLVGTIAVAGLIGIILYGRLLRQRK